jgi:WhiB family transcriptional regulator, redox-sensing transcriptional regulator
MSWYEYAACRSVDPEMFFPVGTTGPALSQLRRAKEVCGHCPVQSMCLEWATLARIDHGVWGGKGEEERRAHKRRSRRRLAAPTRP